MLNWILLVTIVFLVQADAKESRGSDRKPEKDEHNSIIAGQRTDALLTASDRDVIFKRKSPPSDRLSNDVNQSLKPIGSRRPTSATARGSDVSDPSRSGQIISLLFDLSRNMAAMRDVVNDIRFQNHVTYRELKRMLQQQGKCVGCGNSSPSSDMSVVFPPKKPEMGRKPPPLPLEIAPSAAALYAERPQSDQQLKLQQLSPDVAKDDEDHHHQQQQQLQQSPEVHNETELVSEQRCPKEFTYSAELDSCYRMAGDRTTWRLARERCRDFKADLAAVDSPREQRYLNDKARLNQDTKHCDFWIGLVRGRGTIAGGSSWHWIGEHGNGRSPEYTNWNTNEPNNANSYEHCTQMLWVFNWRWNDAHCNYGNACYICQAKPRDDERKAKKASQ